MSDDKLRDDIYRAQNARDLLENELLKEAFQTLQDDYLRVWQHTKSAEAEARETIFKAWHVVGKVQEHLNRVLENGKLAQKELDDLIQKKRIFSVR